MQDGGGRHFEFQKNVNNSELDRAICTKFGWQMHHGHVEINMTKSRNRKLICVTSSNECREHKSVDLRAYKSSQLTGLWYRPVENSPVRAIV